MPPGLWPREELGQAPFQVGLTAPENSGSHKVEREAVSCVWGGGAGVAWPEVVFRPPGTEPYG